MSSALTVAIRSERAMFTRTFVKLLDVLDRPIEHVRTLDEAAMLLLDIGADPAPAAERHYLDTASQGAADLRIACVLDEQDDAVVDTLMASGAAGVLVKSTPPLVLIESLRLLVDGEACRPVPAFPIERLELPDAMREQLSAREQKMLRLMAGGYSIGHVARELSLTRARVVIDMRRILQTVRGRGRVR